MNGKKAKAKWLELKQQHGSKEAHRFYLGTAHWKHVRDTRLKQDNYTCQRCNASRITNPTLTLQVHHKTYCRLWKEKMRDVVTLCGKCHYAIHTHGKISKINYKRRDV